MIEKYQRILDMLEGVKPYGSGFLALCPAHDDKRHSLSVREVDRKLYLRCFKGCQNEDVVQALGIHMRDLFPDSEEVARSSKYEVESEHIYRDESGRVRMKVVRFSLSDGGKSFSQKFFHKGKWSSRRPPGFTLIPYQLNRIVRSNSPILVPEGEKKVDLLWSMGLCATCNPGGSDSWKPEFGSWFSGRHVIAMPDNDPPGESHASRVIGSAIVHGASKVAVLRLSGLEEKEDVVDYIAKGGTKKELLEEIMGAETWEPRSTAPTGE